MRFRVIMLALLAAAFVSAVAVAAGEARNDGFTYDEWDWDNESVNTFTGTIDLGQWSGKDITLQMTADFEPKSKAASGYEPKITHFNGKRLAMLEQSNTITCMPEPGQADTPFSASVQMPEKGHYQKIVINLAVLDHDGRELKKISGVVSKNGESTVQTGSIFYIPFEIRSVALIIAASALLIWCFAIIRNRLLNKKVQTGD